MQKKNLVSNNFNFQRLFSFLTHLLFSDSLLKTLFNISSLISSVRFIQYRFFQEHEQNYLSTIHVLPKIHNDWLVCVFKHCRSKRIYGRLVELANADPQSKLMTMPLWLDYDTLIILFQ